MRIKNILKNRVVEKKDAVMFDIDDTLIFTNGHANTEMIDLLNYSKRLGYKIIIITARPFSIVTRQFTIMQLKKYGIIYDELYLTPALNKGNVKKQSGYNYILSVGDQETDLTHTKYGIKITVF
jgi:ribonucleotide monophosphatase NagD (HAD superfamily)